jgi:hypothetical protein
MNLKKLCLLPFIFCCLFTKAQETNINLHIKNQSIEQVLGILTQQYHFQFSYSSTQINVKTKVSINIVNQNITQTLAQLFSGLPIGFTINNEQITLYKITKYQVTLSGYLKEKGTGELLIGAVVSTMPYKISTTTNAYGFYTITLPADTHTITFHYIGYHPIQIQLNLTQSTPYTIELEANTQLQEVTVHADQQYSAIGLNNIKIPLAEIKAIPSILGEKDVVKYSMLSSGVQKGNEGTPYMFVRGGGPDQNLVLIDEAPIYNAYHFLGLSSLFSGNELRKAELIKGGFSAKYGGRLSSVLDMSMKDGNLEKPSAEATVGVISSRIMLETPIVKNKSSFLISARKSYLNTVSKLLTSTEDESLLDYTYHDIHAKISTQLGAKNRLMLSGYLGNDVFKINSIPSLKAKDDGVIWGNRATSLRWTNQAGNKLFIATSLIYSFYQSRTAMSSEAGSNTAINTAAVQSSITDYTLKSDLDYTFNHKHQFKGGLGYTFHQFAPQTEFKSSYPDILLNKSFNINAKDLYAYTQWNYHPFKQLRINGGLRYSNYTYQQTYQRIEPRFALNYYLPRNWAFQGSYSTMNQYLHLISGFSGIGFPNDMWISSDQKLKPQVAHLYTLGVSKNNLFDKKITLLVEAYYKNLNNTVAMREGASMFSLMTNPYLPNQYHTWSDLVTQGRGYSQGLEVSIKKETGKLTCWLSYTLSKTRFQFDDINLGRWYNPTYDRTHDIGLFANYTFSKKLSASANWVYGTGNAISLPTGQYPIYINDIGGGLSSYRIQNDYEFKNKYRMKSYHRLDIAIQYKHQIAQKINGVLELSIYNVYNRANPFIYQLNNDAKGNRILEQMSLFPIMPSLSWTIKI